MASLIRQVFSKNLIKVCNRNVTPAETKSYCFAASEISNKRLYSNVLTNYEIVDSESEHKLVKAVTENVNNLVASNKEGRLFAVVHVAGKQAKVTEGDVLIVEGYWPPNIGDKISLDKVLLAGAEKFTLIGTPTVQKGLVNVEATVIEKTLSHTKTNFKKKRRKQYMQINFYRIPQTYLRINKVEIKGELNNPPEVRGLETAIF